MTFDEAERAEAEIAGWLACARRGDRRAFARLVRAHHSRVRLQLRRLTQGDAALADDLAQETFVQAWLHLNDFRGDARLATWLHRIALTRFLQHVRRPRLPLEWCEPDTEAANGPAHDPRAVEGLGRDVERALQAPAPGRPALLPSRPHARRGRAGAGPAAGNAEVPSRSRQDPAARVAGRLESGVRHMNESIFTDAALDDLAARQRA